MSPSVETEIKLGSKLSLVLTSKTNREGSLKKKDEMNIGSLLLTIIAEEDSRLSISTNKEAVAVKGENWASR